MAMAAIIAFIAASFSARNGASTGPAARDVAAPIRAAASIDRRACIPRITVLLCLRASPWVPSCLRAWSCAPSGRVSSATGRAGTLDGSTIGEVTPLRADQGIAKQRIRRATAGARQPSYGRRTMAIMLKEAFAIGALSALLFGGCATAGSGDGAASVGFRNGGGAVEVGVHNDAPWKATGFRRNSSST